MAIRLVDGRRAGLIRSALASFPDEAYWRKAISGIRRAVFLSGPVSPATLAEHNRNPDWFLSEGKDGAVNHVKVYEGRMA